MNSHSDRHAWKSGTVNKNESETENDNFGISKCVG